MNKIVIVLFFTMFLVTGCASTPIYNDIFKQESSYNSKEFAVSAGVLYAATIRAICSKNFIVEKEDKENNFILAKRPMQKGKRTTILALQAKIEASQEDKAALYLNAFQTTERLFVTDRTRFFLFIIPLPGGGGKEASRVKEGEKMIDDKEFYQKFFLAIEKEIEVILPAEKAINLAPLNDKEGKKDE